MSRITEVEIVEFSFTARNLGQSADNAQAVYNIGYKPNASLELTKFAVAIRYRRRRRGRICRAVGRHARHDGADPLARAEPPRPRPATSAS